MADARGIRAGAAYVELFVSDSALVRGLQKAGRRLKAFGEGIRDMGTKMAMVGAAVTAPLLGFAKVFASGSHELAKMSQRTGISVEALSELGYAAELSGADMESLEVGIKRMQRAIVTAAGGSKAAMEVFDQLGLTVKDLAGLSPDEQFKLIADRLSQIQDPALRAALAMQLFGRSGTNLLPMMANGAKGIEELQQQARNLGLTASTETVAAGEKLAETLATLWRVVKKLGSTIGAALAPMLTSLGGAMIDLLVKAMNWVKQNQSLVVSIFLVAAGIKLAGIALTILGFGITTIAGIFSTFAAIVAGVGTVLGVLGSILAALLTPIGLVVAAAVALGTYLVVASGIGRKALEKLSAAFAAMAAFAKESLQGIADALAAGDFALAANILWLSLKVAFEKGIGELESAWLGFRNFFVKIAYDAFYGAVAACEIVSHGLEVAWIETTAFMSKLWIDFTSGVSEAWNTTINWVAKRMLELQGLFDSDLDVEAAKKLADQDLANQNNQIERQRSADLNARERQRQVERSQASQLHDATLAEIGKEAQEKQIELDKEAAERVKASEKDLEQAKKEWQEAIGKAKQERQQKQGQQSTPPGKPGGSAYDQWKSHYPGFIDQLRDPTIAVAGTFNAMTARGMSAGGAVDRIAKSNEDIAKTTKRILEQLQLNGPEFE